MPEIEEISELEGHQLIVLANSDETFVLWLEWVNQHVIPNNQFIFLELPVLILCSILLQFLNRAAAVNS